MRPLLAALMVLTPAALLGQDSTEVAVARPIAPAVISGACPFECCHYGPWRLRTPATVRARPSTKAPLVAALKSGTPVSADSGIVIITQIGVVAVRQPYHDPSMNVSYSPGDTLLLLDYLGEGFYNAWYRGHMRQVGEYWSDSPTGDAQLTVEPRGEWWAFILWRDGLRGRRGWIDMRDVGVQGADACG